MHRGCAGTPLKRVIAALELMATIVALKLWMKGNDGRAEIMAEAFTDNKGNAFIVKKGLSTKYPVCRDAPSERFVSEEENVLADALTNLEFGAFNHLLREKVEEENMNWLVLDELMKSSSELYDSTRRSRSTRWRRSRERRRFRRSRRNILVDGPPD